MSSVTAREWRRVLCVFLIAISLAASEFTLAEMTLLRHSSSNEHVATIEDQTKHAVNLEMTNAKTHKERSKTPHLHRSNKDAKIPTIIAATVDKGGSFNLKLEARTSGPDHASTTGLARSDPALIAWQQESYQSSPSAAIGAHKVEFPMRSHG